MKVKDPGAIKRWRGRRDLTQRQLAYLCDCSQNAISLIEKGEMTTLSEDLALSIAKRLDVPWEDLFDERDAPGSRRVATGARTVKRVAA